MSSLCDHLSLSSRFNSTFWIWCYQVCVVYQCWRSFKVSEFCSMIFRIILPIISHDMRNSMEWLEWNMWNFFLSCCWYSLPFLMYIHWRITYDFGIDCYLFFLIQLRNLHEWLDGMWKSLHIMKTILNCNYLWWLRKKTKQNKNLLSDSRFKSNYYVYKCKCPFTVMHKCLLSKITK